MVATSPGSKMLQGDAVPTLRAALTKSTPNSRGLSVYTCDRRSTRAANSPPVRESVRVDKQGVRFGILQLILVVFQRSELMEPGDGHSAGLSGDTRTPGLHPVSRQQSHAVAATQAVRSEYRLQAPHKVRRSGVRQRSTIPGERCSIRISAKNVQCESAQSRPSLDDAVHLCPPRIGYTTTCMPMTVCDACRPDVGTSRRHRPSHQRLRRWQADQGAQAVHRH